MARNSKTQASRRSLKYKLRIAVSLMTILPILACIYLISNYVFLQQTIKPDIFLIIFVSVFIALVGFLLIKQIFDRIMSVSSEARLMAAGHLDRRLNIPREDEVGDLGDALNQLTQRIRGNMDELKNYGEKTAQINVEIQKRVLVLSSLLQISSLVSQGASLEDVLKITTQKACLLANSEAAFLLFREDDSNNFYMKVADGLNCQHLLELKMKEEPRTLIKYVEETEPLIVDKNNRAAPEVLKYLNEKFQYKNMVASPVYIRGKMVGILGIANNKETFIFSKDDLEIMDIFTKQVGIAVENDILTHKVEKLEVKDTLTGLYNKAYISTRLQEEIKRAVAYQRPCAFILFNIDDFKKYYDTYGSLQSEIALKRIASLIKESVSDIDRVARFSDNEFCIVLPEKNTRQAHEIADGIRKKIEFAFKDEADNVKKLTVSGGVSENPLDGITSQELISKAIDLLHQAKAEGKNRILGVSQRQHVSKEDNK